MGTGWITTTLIRFPLGTALHYGPHEGGDMGRTTKSITTAAVFGTTAVLLAGCSVFGGSDPVPAPTDRAVASASPTAPSDGAVRAAKATQSVPTGTVVAETDAVSTSGETRVHVRVVATDRGTFEARLSGYRTTNPQPMTIEFRRHAAPGDGPDGRAVGSTTWGQFAGDDLPDTVSLLDAGSDPSWLHVVVLVPAPQQDASSDMRPGVGSVLAVGSLTWSIPDPYPKMAVTDGTARPGAYGYALDHDSMPMAAGARPLAYRVAHGDEQLVVAERFGITVDELHWLNPQMQVGPDGWLLEDALLNLDPATR